MTAPETPEARAARLLPCPFCGAPAEFDNDDTGPASWIVCTKCGAQGPSSFNDDPAPLWNRREAAAALEASGWRDISTAPKDGTWVLVKTPHVTVAARWNSSWPPGFSYSDAHSWHYLAHPDAAPTHWRPLPAPPDTPDR